MFNNKENLMIKITGKSTIRRTSQPFFEQQYDNSEPISPTLITQKFEITYDWLPELLISFYNSVPSNLEFHINEYTILSLDEITEIYYYNNEQNCKHNYVDFIISYAGMGHINVWSVNPDGLMNKRIDGGANGYDRSENFKNSLNERKENTHSLNIFSLIS